MNPTKVAFLALGGLAAVYAILAVRSLVRLPVRT